MALTSTRWCRGVLTDEHPRRADSHAGTASARPRRSQAMSATTSPQSHRPIGSSSLHDIRLLSSPLETSLVSRRPPSFLFSLTTVHRLAPPPTGVRIGFGHPPIPPIRDVLSNLGIVQRREKCVSVVVVPPGQRVAVDGAFAHTSTVCPQTKQRPVQGNLTVRRPSASQPSSDRRRSKVLNRYIVNNSARRNPCVSRLCELKRHHSWAPTVERRCGWRPLAGPALRGDY